MRNAAILCVTLFLHSALMMTSCIAQDKVSRIEFNSGTRTFRQQIILTRDSVVTIEENFRTDLKPQISRRSMNAKEWNSLLESLKGISLEDIDDLKSPTDKRTYDAAAHGSLILTDPAGKSFSHGFDDDNAHQRLQPLVKKILRFKSPE